MSYTNDKIKVIKIEDNCRDEDKSCSCCGDTKKNQAMWKVSYNSSKIGPLYFCHKCAHTKSDVVKMLDCDDISMLSTTDLLYAFVAILKIKNIQTFSSYHLIEYIKKCKIENKFEYILEDWNSILEKFDSTIASMSKDRLLLRIFPNTNTKVTISSEFPISGVLKKDVILENLEEILAFTNSFIDNEKIIFNNLNPLFNDNNNHIKKR